MAELTVPHSDYFEGVLQLRGGTDEIRTWIVKRVKKDGKALITKIKKVRNGHDFYFSDQHYLQSFGKKLKQTFPGVLKASRKLHTQHRVTSKILYRVNVLFKPIPFRKEQIITLRGDKVKLLAFGQTAQIQYEKSGKKKNISLEQLMTARS
ncbi:hypothetical protein COV18_02490 [Candidatus Woesearchaeota archaeon CG10_big_fil_rev_8_21_14_0_10_37_12]|nr:MAG: hypothetical protein COV18_02490 [Candidatus Woesearchaeota archaeon CG10_big_fil_rev_8_21_14_0_10_37_12]